MQIQPIGIEGYTRNWKWERKSHLDEMSVEFSTTKKVLIRFEPAEGNPVDGTKYVEKTYRSLFAWDRYEREEFLVPMETSVIIISHPKMKGEIYTYETYNPDRQTVADFRIVEVQREKNTFTVKLLNNQGNEPGHLWYWTQKTSTYNILQMDEGWLEDFSKSKTIKIMKPSNMPESQSMPRKIQLAVIHGLTGVQAEREIEITQ